MNSNDTIQSIETELAFVQSEIERRLAHINEQEDFMPEPVGRSHNLQRIDDLREHRNRLQHRLDRVRELVPG
ncbi:MAG: hypothetical protein AAF724_09490 [Pseudomonadota bacterium]